MHKIVPHVWIAIWKAITFFYFIFFFISPTPFFFFYRTVQEIRLKRFIRTWSCKSNLSRLSQRFIFLYNPTGDKMNTHKVPLLPVLIFLIHWGNEFVYSEINLKKKGRWRRVGEGWEGRRREPYGIEITIIRQKNTNKFTCITVIHMYISPCFEERYCRSTLNSILNLIRIIGHCHTKVIF